jgi:hypothetical protein
MDDISLHGGPSSAGTDASDAQKAAPSSAPGSLGAIGAVAAAQAADLWGAAADFNSPAEHAQAAPGAHASTTLDPFASGSVGGQSASPFDAFDAFALPPVATTTRTLPLPMETTHHESTAAFSSPLISFSPVTNMPPPSGQNSSTATAAVDDLLSFSPITAPAPTASSFLMMDDLFLGGPSTSSSNMLPAEGATNDGDATSASLSSSSSSFTLTPPTATAPLSDALLTSIHSVETTMTTTTTTMRGSFSGVDVASATMLDGLTDFSVPQSAPAAFHAGVMEYEQEQQRLSEPAMEISLTNTPPVTGDDGDVFRVASTTAESSPRPVSSQASSAPEAHAPPSEPEASEPVSRHGDDKIHTYDYATRESEAQFSPVEVISVASGWEHGTVVESTSAEYDTGVFTHSHGAIASTESSRVGVEDTTGVNTIAAIAAVDATESAEENSVASVVGDELTSQSYVGAEDGLKVADTEEGVAQSSSSDDIPSPASAIQEFEGFQALSGGSDDEAEAFNAEASAVYAEVVHTELDASRPSVDTGTSLLDLHLRDVADAEMTEEPSVSSPAASVASSSGSSVTGSAFAFISADASSPFSSAPAPQYPTTEDDEHVSNDDLRSSSPIGGGASISITASFRTADVASEDSVPSTDRMEAVGVVGAVDGLLKSADKEDSDGRESTFVSSEIQSSSLAFSTEKEHDNLPAFSTNTDGGFGAIGQQAMTDDGKEENGSGFGGFTPTTVADSTDDGFGGFGGFRQSTATQDNDDDDDFGGFAASKTTATTNDDEDDDFGDFGSGTAWARASADTKDDDDDFDDFTPAPPAQQWGATTMTATPSSGGLSSASSWATPAAETSSPLPPLAAPTDLNKFFASAFPACKAPVAASLLPKPSSFQSGSYAAMSATSVLEQVRQTYTFSFSKCLLS